MNIEDDYDNDGDGDDEDEVEDENGRCDDVMMTRATMMMTMIGIIKKQK